VIDSWELIFVTSGTLGIAEAEVPFLVQAGQTLLLFPGRSHGGIVPYPRDLAFYWFHFTVLPAGEGGAPWELPQLATLASPDRMRELAQLFLADQEASPRDAARASLLLLLMLRELLPAAQSHTTVSPAATSLAQRADTWIRLHLHEPIAAAEIARALHCHPDYLGRACKRVWGHSLTEQIHRLRIGQAKRLLAETDVSIRQLGAEVGFHDPAYFRRLFGRHTGLTPGDYRRRHTRIHTIAW